MHRIHHQSDRHRNNYGDIVWWDMLFGTWENPKEWTRTCGFTPEREERLGEMLRWRDVHADVGTAAADRTEPAQGRAQPPV